MAKYKYETLTDDEDDLEIADQLHYREVEHRNYMRNANAFKALLDAMAPLKLPDQWPDELKQYKNMTRDQVIAAIEDEATETLVLNLLQRKMLRERWRAELHEAGKIESYMAQVKSMLPAKKADRDVILANAKTRRDAKGG